MTKQFKFPSHLLVFLIGTLALLFPNSLSAQTATGPTRDPNALAIASKALQAIAGATVLSDITLEGTATYIAGSDTETGPAALVALSSQQSRITLNLSGGSRQEIRSGFSGAWVGPDGNAHGAAFHNCMVDADWFFPAFSLSAVLTDPTVAVVLIGLETRAGVPVYHLTLSRYLPQPTPDVATLLQQAGTMDLYLGQSTLQPVAWAFNLHSDSAMNVNIPAEIRFGSYRSFGGVSVPTRIQKYVQNSLVLDLSVANVAVNSGVAASYFTLPSLPAGGVK